MVAGPVRPGDEITLRVSMVSPALAGKYCAFFRFVHGENLRFGQKVWCDILVEEVEQIKPLLLNSFYVEKKEEQVVEPVFETVVEESSSLLSEEPEQKHSSLDESIVNEVPIQVPVVQQEEAKVEVKQEVSNDEMARTMYMEELTNAKLKDLSLH